MADWRVTPLGPSLEPPPAQHMVIPFSRDFVRGRGSRPPLSRCLLNARAECPVAFFISLSMLPPSALLQMRLDCPRTTARSAPFSDRQPLRHILSLSRQPRLRCIRVDEDRLIAFREDHGGLLLKNAAVSIRAVPNGCRDAGQHHAGISRILLVGVERHALALQPISNRGAAQESAMMMIAFAWER